ncbi:MAG: clan AA aspartic protease [Chitinophagales bacterium]|jgi:predicted aspartyl protease|nr:clan AA aspartic protease [Chitinophagales bacterium]
MSKKIKIPIDVTLLQDDGYHLFIEASIGNHNVRLLIDTGASNTVLDKKFITDKTPDLKLEVNEQLTTGVGSNTIQSEFTEINDLRIGNITIRSYKVAVLDLMHVNETYQIIQLPPIDGVIGCDFLVEFDAIINMKKKQLRIRAYS